MKPTSLPDATRTIEEVEAPVDEGARLPLVARHFTTAGEDPFDTVEWEVRDARAGDFFQPGVEAPTTWTDDSIGIVAKLYFATVEGIRENSVRQMIHRVVKKITIEGMRQGHFDFLQFSPHSIDDDVDTDEGFDRRVLTEVHDFPARVFYEELTYICLHQIAGFNTPTWLNVGVPGRPQCGHACYILDVEDTMLGDDGIVEWWRKESIIFKRGGGAGVNVSKLRGSMEKLSTGGIASGPLAYVRAANGNAETLKSGGAHRRAAKFVALDADHPDIFEFVEAKVREDRRMRLLMKAGEDLSTFTPEGERNVAEVTSFQSANNSVCATDAFMRAVELGEEWQLTARKSGEIVKTIAARDLMFSIAEAAWQCADPGMIFIDTINQFHTTPSLGPVVTVNTCGEITQNSNTACNLAAINVLRFTGPTGFDGDGFCRVVDVMLTAMDIVNGFSELPTEEIERNTRALRQCGLGLTNLGAAIMARALPYDSDEARDFASGVTALLTGRAYRHSARMARELGAFEHFEDNRVAMIDVVQRQLQTVEDAAVYTGLWKMAKCEWHVALKDGVRYGFRNSQMTAMMPTGTVSFLLGADTTGVEPAFSLVTHKKLAAAGSMTMVNQSARLAAQTLGYGLTVEEIEMMDLGDFSFVAPEHLPVFATAIGSNSIQPMGHLKMVEAIQRFTTQAISKTLNLPNETTATEIYDLYMEAWRRGVKVVSVYRDGSKATQVLSSVDALDKIEKDLERAKLTMTIANTAPADGVRPQIEWMNIRPVPTRRRLPRTRPRTVRHKISVQSTIGLHEGYVSASFFDDDKLGEVFLEGFGRMGGFTQNALSAWMTDFSIALQYGVPFDVLVRKHIGHSDETGGVVVPDSSGEPLVIRSCDSMIDYVARWLVSVAGDVDLQEELGVMTDEVKVRRTEALTVQYNSGPHLPKLHLDEVELVLRNSNGHAPEAVFSVQACPQCGAPMRRTGTCMQCASCGHSAGGCG